MITGNLTRVIMVLGLNHTRRMKKRNLNDETA
jgi:hypothetical protein